MAEVERFRVLAAMSGGVDSAVAAALLVRAGHEVAGVTLRLHGQDSAGRGCCSLEAIEAARRAARRMGIRHHVFDMRAAFERAVIAPFAAEYARGRTPNPCIECNRRIKFAALLDRARLLGYSHVATGHYARIERGAAGWRLLRARDAAKDQTYALYAMTQDQLGATLFPVGDLAAKSETRRLAAELDLGVAETPDSQEICFVGPEGYAAQLDGVALAPGPIEHVDGRTLGRHDGIGRYTPGQRRRLPASSQGPLFVVRIEPERRAVIVGPAAATLAAGCRVEDVSWIAGAPPPLPLAASVRIRYNATDVPGALFAEGAGVRCVFDRPQRATTPGQAAVFSMGDEVLGGGTIAQALGLEAEDADGREGLG